MEELWLRHLIRQKLKKKQQNKLKKNKFKILNILKKKRKDLIDQNFSRE